MTWADVTRPPSDRVLRQFAGLSLAFMTAAGAWRWLQHGGDARAFALIAAGVIVGFAGLAWPRSIRLIFAAAMLVSFPIGWTVSKVVLALIFYVVFAPLSWMFRLAGRDPLRLRRQPGASVWLARPEADALTQYFRQS